MNKEALDYAKSRYEEEQSRFDYMESKSERFLTVATIAIAAFTGFVGFLGKEFLTPSSIYQWTVLCLFSFTYVSLAATLMHSMLALKIEETKIAPRNEKVKKYLLESEAPEIEKFIYSCYMDTAIKLIPIIDKKSRNLELAYQEIAISGFLITLTIVITTIAGINQC